MRVAFVANPYAGRGRAKAAIADIAPRARALGLDVVVETTRGPGDGVRAARQVRDGADVVVIIGGDGTVHEVVNGLMPQPPPIAILGAGTGNDFASLLAGPRDLNQLVSMLETGEGARLDVLDFGDRFCVNSAGMGFEGMVNQRSHEIKRLKGTALYLLAVFKTLAALRCPYFDIRTDDEHIVGNKLLVSIGNGVRTGGGFYLTPDARPDDGLIDLCVCDAIGRFNVLTLLPKSLNGSHTSHPRIRMLRTRSLTIETDPDFPMHVDGELVEHAPATLRVRVRSRILPVLCGAHPQNRISNPLERII